MVVCFDVCVFVSVRVFLYRFCVRLFYDLILYFMSRFFPHPPVRSRDLQYRYSLLVDNSFERTCSDRRARLIL
jgi:hypothetical protein